MWRDVRSESWRKTLCVVIDATRQQRIVPQPMKSDFRKSVAEIAFISSSSED